MPPMPRNQLIYLLFKLIRLRNDVLEAAQTIKKEVVHIDFSEEEAASDAPNAKEPTHISAELSTKLSRKPRAFNEKLKQHKDFRVFHDWYIRFKMR